MSRARATLAGLADNGPRTIVQDSSFEYSVGSPSNDGAYGMDKTYQPVRFSEKLSRITELWQPRVVAELNDYQFKVVRIEGDFI